MEYLKRDTKLMCECSFQWQEKLDFELERRYKVRGTDGLVANAIVTCPNCGYEGLARGIIPANSSPLTFYLKREFSLYYPRGGWKHQSDLEEVEGKENFNPANLEIPSLSVHLYEDPLIENLDLKEIAYYLEQKLGSISVDIRRPFFTETSAPHTKDLAEELANARVQDFYNPAVELGPIAAEVETERNWLRNVNMKTQVFYDGFKLLAAARELLEEDESTLQHIHLIFTHRIFGTWDEKDRRYHARLSVCGLPNLISSTGIVEAPAKPRNFYSSKRKSVESKELKERFMEAFVDYDDQRLTEVMKGYAIQAILYHLTLRPFCTDDQCRLFNAHWQEEIIKTQLEKPEFCAYHQKVLDGWRKKFSS